MFKKTTIWIFVMVMLFSFANPITGICSSDEIDLPEPKIDFPDTNN